MKNLVLKLYNNYILLITQVVDDIPPPQFLCKEDAAWAKLPEPGYPQNSSRLSHAVDMPSPPAKEIIIYDFSEIMLVGN